MLGAGGQGSEGLAEALVIMDELKSKVREALEGLAYSFTWCLWMRPFNTIHITAHRWTT